MTTTRPAPVFCQRCGHNTTAERPVAFGPLSVDPHGLAAWRGRRIPLTASQFLLFGALAQAAGKVVSKDVLADRAGYDGNGDPHGVVDIIVSRIRRALRGSGAPPTIIRTERGRGCRLDVALLLELEDPAKC